MASRRLWVLALCALFLVPAKAQGVLDYPLDTLNGEEVYLYPVEQSMGKMAVGRKFGISVDEIEQRNPQIINRGLQLNEILIIPTGRKVEQPTVQQIQPVQEVQQAQEVEVDAAVMNYPLDTIDGEEVYVYHAEQSLGKMAVGRKFHISVKDIEQRNPQIKNRGLQLNEELLIPTGRKIKKEIAVVPEKHQETTMPEEPETLTLIAEPDTLIVPETIISLEDSIVDGRRVVEYALLLPFESQQMKRRDVTDKMMEVYQGVLLALHDMQDDSTLYRLRVYDTERSERRVKALCDSAELDHVHGILGLVSSIQIERMAEWCAARHVPLLLPFSDDVPLENHPYVMQFNSTDKQEADSLCQWIIAKGDDAHCVVVDTRSADIAASVRILREHMDAKEIPYSTLPLRSLINDSITQVLDPNKENIIILHTDRFQHARLLLSHLTRVQYAGYRMRLISQYSWQKERIDMPQVYTSVFTSDIDHEQYDSLWSETFVTKHVSETPRYDLLGYDLMRALIEWNNGIDWYIGLQSVINWKQEGEGGWQNATVKVVEK